MRFASTESVNVYVGIVIVPFMFARSIQARSSLFRRLAVQSDGFIVMGADRPGRIQVPADLPKSLQCLHCRGAGRVDAWPSNRYAELIVGKARATCPGQSALVRLSVFHFGF